MVGEWVVRTAEMMACRKDVLMADQMVGKSAALTESESAGNWVVEKVAKSVAGKVGKKVAQSVDETVAKMVD